ncbi:uncharacterized protein [Argopecten irradians]|uniref:uncharacterized protein n=1 Tax=Argopecten irradians TaxID=31199 RepID=UPI00371D6D17
MLIPFAIVAVFVGVRADTVCPQTSTVVWIEDKTDCSTFFMCYQGRHFKYICPSGLVWAPDSRMCVKKGSPEDKCTTPVTARQPCVSGVKARESQQDNCAKYYECGVSRTAGSSTPTLMECPYPLLFDEQKERCEFPEVVKCDQRKEPTDPCEYDVNRCDESADCPPCYVRFPSCKGLPEGLNPWKGKEWTPHFTVCKKERVVYSGTCTPTDSGQQRMFNPDERTCVEPKILTFSQP